MENGTFRRTTVGWFTVVITFAAGCSAPPAQTTDGGAPPTRPHVSASVGPEGGRVELGDDVSLQIPAGALEVATTITVTQSDEAPPTGLDARSPVYRFEPEGLRFAQPVTVSVKTQGDPATQALYWSADPGFLFWLNWSVDGGAVPSEQELRAVALDAGVSFPGHQDDPPFMRLPSHAEGATLVAEVRHFSRVVVASRRDFDRAASSVTVDRAHADTDGGEIVLTVHLRDANDAGIPWEQIELTPTTEPSGTPPLSLTRWLSTDALGDATLTLTSMTPGITRIAAGHYWWSYWYEVTTCRYCFWSSCWESSCTQYGDTQTGRDPIGEVVVSFGDVDECATSFNVCAPNADCTDTPDAFTCACRPGFSGDGFSCADIDECASSPCAADATCTNTPGSYFCTCNAGYLGDGLTCVDIDECATNHGGCAAEAACTNTPGSRQCQCLAGFRGDGLSCTDIDECAEGTAGCSADATCLNAPGTFGCSCNPGFSGDGQTCTDIDECATNHGGCAAVATCTNRPGSFQCTCPAGYLGDGVTCTDIDECSNGTCSPIATCVNLPGSFSCTCPAGYSGDGLTCVDVDECAVGHGGCAQVAICTNLPGGYSCTCPLGYTGDGVSCADIDECTLPPLHGGCDYQAQCTNLPGGVQCTCQSGFTGDGFSCADIDECALGLGTRCALNSVCQNTPGSYDCTCMPGFQGDPTVGCTDIDECALGTIATCDIFGECVNYPGTFGCRCLPGFQGDGYTCLNIDECQAATSPCDPNAQCADLPGSFTCTCNPGWSGDGTSCVNTNECVLQPPVCGPHSTCTDTAGGYTCDCDPGWVLSGADCVDVDECLTANGGCDPLALCANLPGSRSCLCPSGTAGDGLTCLDIDECASTPGPCGPGGTCTNTVPGYECTCAAGYTLVLGVCTDIDECLGPTACSPHATCQNLPGSYSCQCDTGYAGDGYLCNDIDECAVLPAACGPNTTCVNTDGAFQCDCLTGFHPASTWECVDTDECAQTPPPCDPHATCLNTAGAFDCACDPGYSGNGGSGSSLVCTAVATSPPGVTTGVTAAAEGAQGLRVTWPAVVDAAQYEVRRGSCSVPNFTLVDTVTGTSFLDTSMTGCQPEQPWCYTVTAINSLGSGAASSPTAAAQWPAWAPVQQVTGTTVLTSQAPRQSFTAGSAGVLRMIELSWGIVGQVGPSDTFDLTVYDANGVSLGTVHKWPPTMLNPPMTGFHGIVSSLGLFDVSGLGIQVSGGQQFSFELHATTSSVETCEPPGFCSLTFTACATAADCGLRFSIEAAPSDVYTGGELTLGGSPTGTDLAFQVLIY